MSGPNDTPIDATRLAIPLSLLITVASACVATPLGVGLWTNNRFNTIDTRLTLIEAKLGDKSLEDRIRSWTMLFQALNPTAKVPDFR